MGVETALLAIAATSGAGKAYTDYEAYKEREKALDVQGKQLKIENQQKTLQNYAVMEKVIDAQTAHMTTTGAAFSSPSFNAIQRNTLNIGSKEFKNLEIEESIAEENLKLEKKNVRNTLYAQLFGDVGNFAGGAASVYSKMPSKGG